MTTYTAFLRNHAQSSAAVYVDEGGICRISHSLQFDGLSEHEVQVIVKALGRDFDETQAIWAKHSAGVSVKKLANEYECPLEEMKERLRLTKMRANDDALYARANALWQQLPGPGDSDAAISEADTDLASQPV